MSERKRKIPSPFTVTLPDPGGKFSPPSGLRTQAQQQSDGAAFVAWVVTDMKNKESLPQPDYSTGSESGFNNG